MHEKRRQGIAVEDDGDDFLHCRDSISVGPLFEEAFELIRVVILVVFGDERLSTEWSALPDPIIAYEASILGYRNHYVFNKLLYQLHCL